MQKVLMRFTKDFTTKTLRSAAARRPPGPPLTHTRPSLVPLLCVIIAIFMTNCMFENRE